LNSISLSDRTTISGDLDWTRTFQAKDHEFKFYGSIIYFSFNFTQTVRILLATDHEVSDFINVVVALSVSEFFIYYSFRYTAFPSLQLMSFYVIFFEI
jgi:hypothetical protein